MSGTVIFLRGSIGVNMVLSILGRVIIFYVPFPFNRSQRVHRFP